MALPKTDAFQQTSGGSQTIAVYDAGYSVLEGGINVPNNAAKYLGSGTTYNTARWGTDAPDADHYAQIVWTSSLIAAGYYVGPGVRCQSGANTSYHVDSNGAEYYLSKCSASTQATLVGPVSLTTLAAGDVFRLEVTTVGGNAVLKVYKALAASPTTFVQQGSTYTDSSSPILTAGYGGIFAYGNPGAVGPTDFKVDSLGGAATVAQGSRRHKNTIRPGTHPDGFGYHFRTRRNNATNVTTISGAISATDADDTSVVAGSETFAAVVSVTDDTDTASASGVVWNPAASRRAKTPVHPGAGPYNLLRFKKSNRNTTIFAVSASGSVVVTDETDTSVIAGTETIQGTVAQTDATDTSTITGTETVQGALSVSDAADTSALAGTETIPAAVSVSDSTDTSAIAGTETIAAAIAVTDATDTAALTGTETISGVVSQTDATDTSALPGTLTISGAIGVTDATDTCSITDGGPTGTIAVTDTSDTSAIAGTETITGAVSASDATDTATITGTEQISGSISVADATDAAIIAAVESLIASIGVTDATDTSEITGNASSNATGTISVTDATDAAIIAAVETLIGSISVTDATDTSEFGQSVPENVNLTCSITTGLSLGGTITTNINLTTVIV